MTAIRHTGELLAGYPKSLTLSDGTTVLVRPLEPTDLDALLRFFRGVPAEDRWWLREDVSNPEVVRRWVLDLDYERVLPLVAIADDAIVADATLHRRGFGARRLLGEIRMVVAPAFRGRGLAYALLAELAETAAAAGLVRLVAEVASRAQAGAREAVEQFGFAEAAVLPDHLLGPDGTAQDLIYLTFSLADV